MYNVSIWRRTGESVINARMFLGIFTSCVAMGFITTAFVGFYTAQIIGMNGEIVLAAVIGGTIGLIIAFTSEHAAFSAAGLALIAGAFGVFFGGLLGAFDPWYIPYVFLLAALLFVGFGIFGTWRSELLESKYFWLIGGIWVLVGGPLLGGLMRAGFGVLGASVSGFDTALAMGVCGYAIFDFYRASKIPFTVDNAVDTAVAIYLDFTILIYYLIMVFGFIDSILSLFDD